MENKKEFTKLYLEPLAKQVNNRVHELNYLVASPSGEEYVEIVYRRYDGLNQTAGYRKRVCVSCDNYRAMTIDVIKVV